MRFKVYCVRYISRAQGARLKAHGKKISKVLCAVRPEASSSVARCGLHCGRGFTSIVKNLKKNFLFNFELDTSPAFYYF